MDRSIKICGFTNKESLEKAASLEIEYAGLVFHPPSVRYLTIEKATEISLNISKKIKLIGVFVNPSDEILNKSKKQLNLHGIQLHGNETVERISQIKKNTDLLIIKAISIEKEKDIEFIKKFENVADMLLFDSKPEKKIKSPGGNAKTFDWDLLKNININKPWFLSGGLSINNIHNALEKTQASLLDISSGVEVIRGKKDLILMEKFVRKVREFKK